MKGANTSGTPKCSVTSQNFNTFILLNGKPFGRPDDDALRNGKLPESPDSFALLTSFILPEKARSSIDTEITIRTEHRADQAVRGKYTTDRSMIGVPTVLTVGKLRLSLKKARAYAPEWTKLSGEQAAKLLGVEKSSPMWQLILRGRPSIHVENDYLIGSTPESDIRREEIERARDLFNEDKDVVVDFVTPQLKPDSLLVYQDFVDAAWMREGGNSLSPWTNASKYKHVLNQSTIASTAETPRQEKVPATIVFDDSLQHKIAMLYATRDERQFQKDQQQDLASASGITAVFMPDPSHIRAGCATPMIYLAFVKVPEHLMHLAPRVGQSGQLTLPTVSRIPHKLGTKESAEIEPSFSDDKLVDTQVSMCFIRVNESGSLGPLSRSNCAVYRVIVPIDRDTKKLKWPQKLSIPDIFRDADGNFLSVWELSLRMMNEPGLAVGIKLDDSDKPYRVEFNALGALAQPYTVSERDRPSQLSCELYDQIVANEFKDYLPLKEYFPFLNDVYRGNKSIASGIRENFRMLSSDKKAALGTLLDDRKKIKLIEGPPGTGKSYFAAVIALAMLHDDTPAERFNEEVKPIPGVKLSDAQLEDRMEKLATNEGPGPVSESKRKPRAEDEPANASSDQPKVRVMYLIGQNKPVNDMCGVLKAAARKMRITQVRGKPLVILRVHSAKIESEHIPVKYAELQADLATQDPAASGLSQIVLNLVLPMTRNIDEWVEKQRKARCVDVSLAELSCQKFETHREEKYLELSQLIEAVRLDPKLWEDKRAAILRHVLDGPMTDALTEAHIVLTTPVIAADFWMRKFTFDAIFLDEAARSKETTSLIPVAFYTPRTYIFLGDSKQCPPMVFSEYQDRTTRTKQDFAGTLLGLNTAGYLTQDESRPLFVEASNVPRQLASQIEQTCCGYKHSRIGLNVLFIQ